MQSLLNPAIQKTSSFESHAGTNTFFFWLTGLKYLEEKKAILAEFSCSGLKRTTSFAFFPSLIVSKKAVSKELLKDKTSKIDRQKFELIESEHCFKIVSANYSLLKELEKNLADSKIFSINPEPERQFLLENNWVFFGAFEFEPGGENALPAKKDSFLLPDVKTDFFSEPMPETIKELAKIDLQDAKKILSLISLSKILLVPIEKIPVSGFAKQELFLENILFKNNFAPAQEHAPESAQEKALFSRNVPEPEPSFSHAIIASAFYNIGFESIDCDCCKPDHIKAQNILPNSIAEVEFQKDAFYFESVDSGFAMNFHEKNGLKQNRKRRKKEFFLNHFPVGPFNRNQKAEILLPDAIALEKNREAKIVSIKEKHWVCRQESFFSREIKALDKELSRTSLFLEETQTKCLLVAGNGLMSFLAVEQDFSWQFALEHKKNIEFFLEALPKHVSSWQSKYYNSLLADAIEKAKCSASHVFSAK